MAASLTLVAGAQAQNVVLVPYAELQDELTALIDFEAYARVPSPGEPLDGIEAFDGAGFAERFRGQVTVQQGGFDTLLALPEAPLRLEPGPPGQNLAVEFLYYLTNQMKGMAPPGFPSVEAGGEGAIAVLFDRDQSALGFRVTSEPRPRQPAPRGRMTVAFFRRDGVLIETLEVELDWDRAGYGFRRVGGIEDIAGIAITNRDPEGIAIDDVIFERNRVVGWLLR